MEPQYCVDSRAPEPPPLTLTTMINIIKEALGQGRITDQKTLTLMATEGKEPTVLKVLNPASRVTK